jgi:hypothetical protein
MKVKLPAAPEETIIERETTCLESFLTSKKMYHQQLGA